MEPMDGQAERFSARHGGFSKPAYDAILRSLVRAGYFFVGVESLGGATADSYAFLRHDIDLDLGASVEVARWDAALGIKSTFFTAVQSPFFDVTTPDSVEALNEILALGHDICLHLDSRDPLPGIATYSKLQKMMPGLRTDYATLHSPDSSLDSALSSFGLLDALVSSNGAGFTYVSDAQGAWRYGHPLETSAFAQRVPLHVNIHPEWWVSAASNPFTLLADPDLKIREAAANWFPKIASANRTDDYCIHEPVA